MPSLEFLFLPGFLLLGVLCLSVPLIFSLLAIYLIEKQYRSKIHHLALAEGWQYVGGVAWHLSGRDIAGDEWSLNRTNVESANYIWQIPLHTQNARLGISARQFGMRHGTLFTGMSPHPIGSPDFQRRYFTAANDRAMLEQLLTPEIVQMLLDWPNQSLQPRQLRISVKNGRLRISTRINHRPDDISRLIRLGLAIKQALAAPLAISFA